MPVTADLLRLVPLFAGMSDRSFESIADVASEVAFAAGDDLVRQGDPGWPTARNQPDRSRAADTIACASSISRPRWSSSTKLSA